MVFQNIYESIYFKIVGESHYSVGKNIAEDASATYFVTKKVFCRCCRMQLRGNEQKENTKKKMRAKKKLQYLFNKTGSKIIQKNCLSYYKPTFHCNQGIVTFYHLTKAISATLLAGSNSKSFPALFQSSNTLILPFKVSKMIISFKNIRVQCNVQLRVYKGVKKYRL